ncbi:PREDICTED: CASP-like protein 4C1 isoform X1 [Tarenaya hassleriana]|uniref:CASP-like protein 4C1 isoform X1 n=1 Tax=Tarenaya hassleriana TaxID=28532 RepID=UPI00053C611C|nr:PREDICTED: CASP-like protein 4C1 isoform X1 [Tarenaya hassleriana]
MRSPQGHRNGESPSPHHHNHHRPPQTHFHSTVAAKKLRRFNSLILLLRLASFSFSLASAVFMLTNSRGDGSPHWYDFDAFRFVLVANAIVAVYSVFELGASVWEISRETTVWPEAFQVWFDFGHDQAFTYMLLAGGSGAAGVARTMRGSETCAENAAFCTQTYISLGLGFASFLFLAFSSCLSGFRVASFLITGSRFHV